MKKILGLNGSATKNSSNLAILKMIAELGKTEFDFEVIDDLSELPPFKTEFTDHDVPEKIVEFRNQIENADGVIICTPEYVFSIPSRLKNAIEWCVSTIVFSDKPTGIITASAHGEKGHQELKLIMETLQAKLTDETMLIIQGVKGKVNKEGEISDEKAKADLKKFVESFSKLVGV
jgi:chromate reductase, NAD(P)H dehydrogenase (quinone)